LRPLAAWGLCAIGANAEDAALGLLQGLEDKDYFVRVCAAYALGTSNWKHRNRAIAALRKAARADGEEITSDGLPLLIGGGLSFCLMLGVDEQHLLLLEGLLRNRHPFQRYPTPFLFEEAFACLGAPQFRLVDPDTKQTLAARWRRLPIAALEDLNPAAAREERAARRKVEKELAAKAAREQAEREKEAQRRRAAEKAKREQEAREYQEKVAKNYLRFARELQKDPDTRGEGIKAREIHNPNAPSGTLQMYDTILADNTADSAPDLYGSVTSLGHTQAAAEAKKLLNEMVEQLPSTI
jgi:hypothetical protein